MSCIRCDGCDSVIDTDDDVEGLFEDASPFRYWCSSCVEAMDSEGMVLALKTQDPDRYKELTE